MWSLSPMCLYHMVSVCLSVLFVSSYLSVLHSLASPPYCLLCSLFIHSHRPLFPHIYFVFCSFLNSGVHIRLLRPCFVRALLPTLYPRHLSYIMWDTLMLESQTSALPSGPGVATWHHAWNLSPRPCPAGLPDHWLSSLAPVFSGFLVNFLSSNGMETTTISLLIFIVFISFRSLDL